MWETGAALLALLAPVFPPVPVPSRTYTGSGSRLRSQRPTPIYVWGDADIRTRRYAYMYLQSYGLAQQWQSFHLSLMPATVIGQGKLGDGQLFVIFVVLSQDVPASIRTERTIRHGNHHHRKRVAKQAHRRDLAVRERTAQLVGRSLERHPVRTRAIQVDGSDIRTLAAHDLTKMLVQQPHQTNAGRKGRHFDF